MSNTVKTDIQKSVHCRGMGGGGTGVFTAGIYTLQKLKGRNAGQS